MRIYWIILLCASTLLGCRKAPVDEITLPIQRLSIGFMGGADTLDIDASNGSWSASCDAEWIALKKLGDTSLVVTSAPNISTSQRTSNIKFALGNLIKPLFVIQLGIPDGSLEHTMDSLALIAIYNACGGNQWYHLETNNDSPWPLEKPISEWHGVGTIPVGGHLRVYSLDLTALGVTGSLPEQMKNLTTLRTLSLSGGDLVGNPMDILSQLQTLRALDLSYNYSLDVSTVTNIGSLSNLASLNLSGINMKGKYPTYLGDLPHILILSMAGCELSGAIDESIRKMTQLVILDLSDNPMKTAFPQWIVELTELQELNLSLCSLGDQLPIDFGNLKHLRQVKLGVNALSGTVPASIGQLSELEVLNLSDNRLTAIDDQIAQCQALTYLDISHNLLTALPPPIGAMISLEQLFASGNKLEAIGESIFAARSLEIVDLSANQIEGELSPQWGSMNKLEMLILSGNNLVGTIPVEILGARRLEKLAINLNRMSGRIADAIVNDVRFGGSTIFNGDQSMPMTGVWNPKFYICPQQPNYGFTNCDYQQIDWKDENSGGYIGRR